MDSLVRPQSNQGELNLFNYAVVNPIGKMDPLGLKEFEMCIWLGGSIGYAILGGGVYDVTIRDMETGETTMYTVTVFGVGVGLPSIRGSSRTIKFETDNQCDTSESFEGNGYMGGASAEVIAGIKLGGGIKIPNGPFIPGKLIGWERGGIDIGVSHSLAYWSH